MAHPLQLLFILFITQLSAINLPGKELPFPEGERLEYQMRWNFLRVGTAILLRNTNTTLEGKPCLHFTMTARTYGIADKIFKVRDKIDSYTDLKLQNTLHYKQTQREGKTERDIVVRFDRENQIAHYTNYGKPLKGRDPLKIRDGILDPLSIMYALRAGKPEVGDLVKLPATDGKKIIEVEVGVLKREEIKVPAGKFPSIVLAPATKDLRGVFEKTKNSKIEIWVSDDGHYYPLRVKSKVIVGSFIGELDSINSAEN